MFYVLWIKGFGSPRALPTPDPLKRFTSTKTVNINRIFVINGLAGFQSIDIEFHYIFRKDKA